MKSLIFRGKNINPNLTLDVAGIKDKSYIFLVEFRFCSNKKLINVFASNGARTTINKNKILL